MYVLCTWKLASRSYTVVLGLMGLQKNGFFKQSGQIWRARGPLLRTRRGARAENQRINGARHQWIGEFKDL